MSELARAAIFPPSHFREGVSGSPQYLFSGAPLFHCSAPEIIRQSPARCTTTAGTAGRGEDEQTLISAALERRQASHLSASCSMFNAIYVSVKEPGRCTEKPSSSPGPTVHLPQEAPPAWPKG
ncbi:hypothetical protein AOLI_G00231820 [Acnodon oligacanthus]